MKNLLNFIRPFEVSFLPFRKDIRKYSLMKFKADLFSAFLIALLAIPQSIAYALLADLPSFVGLFTAIIGVIVAAVFGSSKHLVVGPSTATAILLQTTIRYILSRYFPDVQGSEKDALSMQLLMHIVLLVGVLQLILSRLNIGKILQFVSRSVVLGYFLGVVLTIYASQLFYFLGIPINSEPTTVLARLIVIVKNIQLVEVGSVFIGLLSLMGLWVCKRYLKRWPYPLIIIITTGSIAYFINHYWIKNPDSTFYIWVLGDMPMTSGFTHSFFQFPINFSLFGKIFFSAIPLAFLAILEVYSISRGLAARSGQYIRSNQEVYGLGLSNIVLGLFGGALPASGSASRSMMNFENGGKTRFAAAFSGLIIAFLILFLSSYIRWIPLASLAALLFTIVVGIVDFKQVKLCLRASKGDLFAFIITFLSCLFLNLNLAFFIGIAISLIFFLQKVAKLELVEYAFASTGRLKIVPKRKRKYCNIRIIGIKGEMFFAAVDIFQNTVKEIAKEPNVKVIILRLNGVSHIDASACFAILNLEEYLETTKRHLVLSGVSEEVWKTMQKTKVINKLTEDNIFLGDEINPQHSTWLAFLRAKIILGKKEDY
ncbi:MAG TPA: SulP family inorganic anion transporter [Chlamydiales bacterium]|nr:SulP family inorganic anion transporter [Chlamydiales bacterium]